ncbi:Lsr2 protein [Nocardia amikacinitolerans]|uniref:Lsr2 dimerization domain-containing protein n=1 Tax=Nocardia amikacinitolerans TaxID=756689 RepID=UPI00082EECC2|nr:histone-like nucleoid-structuring protein Lsr2 [Nocardia amikacinitolerans]MCP2316733.1 Lsr2 protein [Nocardia amikacinitolerans]
MPKKTIVQFLDDLDGKELPEDTEPTFITYKGTSYKLYLSDINKGKLDTALEKFIKDAEVVTAGTAAGAGGGFGAKPAAQVRVEAAGHTLAEVRAWAMQQDGLKVSEKGRLSEEVWTKFEEAHSS